MIIRCVERNLRHSCVSTFLYKMTTFGTWFLGSRMLGVKLDVEF